MTTNRSQRRQTSDLLACGYAGELLDERGLGHRVGLLAVHALRDRELDPDVPALGALGQRASVGRWRVRDEVCGVRWHRAVRLARDQVTTVDPVLDPLGESVTVEVEDHLGWVAPVSDNGGGSQFAVHAGSGMWSKADARRPHAYGASPGDWNSSPPASAAHIRSAGLDHWPTQDHITHLSKITNNLSIQHDHHLIQHS